MGLAGEFLDALQAAGGAGPALPFGRTQFVPHDSFTWKERADRFLKSTGIKTLYHTTFLHHVYLHPMPSG